MKNNNYFKPSNNGIFISFLISLMYLIKYQDLPIIFSVVFGIEISMIAYCLYGITLMIRNNK